MLSLINEEIQKYAETIARVINIDVEIMSEDLIRIAGTGILKSRVGESMKSDSTVYREVIRSGKIEKILNPREDSLCKGCKNRKNCKEVMEISAPIIYEEKVIGVIGLICFDEKTKTEFILKEELYIGFIEQISSFISSKLYEVNKRREVENNNEVLTDIIERVSKAVEFPSEERKSIYEDREKFINYVQSLSDTRKKKYISASEEMRRIYKKIEKVAKTNTTVLITGESGVGKEIIAREVHEKSERANHPFIIINCGAIPENLIESELFGYAKGAFTGANPKGKIGLFQMAHKGSIFLDEIGDMPFNLQVKLLRVLQEKIIYPIGSEEGREVDVRIIAATNQNLEDMVRENKFREDLYYRLNVFPVYIPPLRERLEDIKDLSMYFIKKYSKDFKIKEKRLSKDVLSKFLDYSWEGNIRELKNTIEYIMNIIEDEEEIILEKHLPKKILGNKSLTKEQTLEELEKEAINNLVVKYGDKNKERIAKILGIGIATLYRKIKYYNL